MKNWQKVLKFTLKQAVTGKKYLSSTIIVGIVVFVAAIVSNLYISGAFNKDSQIKALKAVYIVNETDLSLDTDSFIEKHKSDYPELSIRELSNTSAQEVASDPMSLGENEAYSLVLEIAEDEESCNLTAYIPSVSMINSDEAYDFVYEFEDTVRNSKLENTEITEDELNMVVSDIHITETKAEEVEEAEEFSFLAYMTPMVVMLILYFLIIAYGQSIGQTVSAEKTSKLMEYLLTLTGPSGIIFGKVTAVFLEALIQIAIWIVCGLCGLFISNAMIVNFTGAKGKDIIATFMDLLPEGGISDNFAVLMVLALVALLAAFLFYCFVSALFASFAATAEDLTQTTSLSLMTMVVGFLLTIYVPMFTDNSKIGTLIIRLIPFTSAFAIPGQVIGSKITILEYFIFLALLIFFTVLLAILTGRVYKNRLFKKGTKGIWAEIVAAITGKVVEKPEEDTKGKELSEIEKAAIADSYSKKDSAKKTYTIVGFGLLALILGANALGGLVGNVIANLMAANKHANLLDVYQDTTFLVVNNMVAMYLIACPLCALVMKLSNDSLQKPQGHISRNMYLRSIFAIFPITVGLAYLSNHLAAAISGGEAENSFINTVTAGDNILAMIMVSICAPVFEELVFRKLIIDRTRRYGEFVAILYSSVAFGLFHCNLYQIFYAFAIGLILGYVYVRTGNVILTIIMHFIVNSSSSVLAPLAPNVYKYFVYIMIALGILSILYTLIKRDVKLETTRDEIASKELSSVAFFNSGTILFTVACIMLTIYSLVVSTLS